MNRQKIRNGLLAYMMLLFPLVFIFFSPYIIVASAAEGIVSASPMMFGMMFLSAIVCSRLFCGWLCPGGAIQDQVATSNNKPWNGKWANRAKYIIWGIWLGAVILLWAVNWPLRLNFFNMTEINLEIVIVYFFVVSIIYLFALLTGKRGVCHSLCWMAPFMVLGEKTADVLHLPRFRLTADPAKCINCGQCTKRCPMSLEVQTMVGINQMDSAECIACLVCVDQCPSNAIRAGICSKKLITK